jgi:hypothetical protein
MRQFLAGLGAGPMLLVTYRDDYDGSVEVWGGRPEQWPEHLSDNLAPDMDEEELDQVPWRILSWDLIVGNLVSTGYDEDNPMGPWYGYQSARQEGLV